jgi:hypothetical protein
VLSPEQKLWREVLVLAYEDAEHGAARDQAAADAADIDLPDPIHRVRGRRYLRADNPEEAVELEMVCDFAGLPADRVIAWARRHYARKPNREQHATTPQLEASPELCEANAMQRNAVIKVIR